MCTVVVGIHPLGRGSLILAANRDENPERPSSLPGLLSPQPRVAGGRDAVAGGTWLAVRSDAAVAMLNRRPRPGTDGASADRSRGLLALDIAGVSDTGGSLSDAAYRLLERRVGEARYAPFALGWLSPESSWIATHEPGADLLRTRIESGWHVLTHADLDDATEPRTARLLALLRRAPAGSIEEAEARLLELMGLHGEPRPEERGEQAPVCLHSGRMVTVSSAIVSFARGKVRYRHVEGRPCTVLPTDYTHLLDPASVAGGTP